MTNVEIIRSLQLHARLKKLVKICTEKGLKLATAESCTGGMISEWITSVPGSSTVFECGICSYSNRIKHKVLGVSEETLEIFTEYSEQCAEEMARGALKISGADIAVATTGVAGPSGGTEENPVGTVYICVCTRKFEVTKKLLFEGSRQEIRCRASREALKMLFATIDKLTHNLGGK